MTPSGRRGKAGSGGKGSRTPRRRWAYQRGQRAETLAAWCLRLKGFRILERSLKSRRGSSGGEIDLIARRGQLVIFVEVKARGSVDEARAAISQRQQKRIRQTAETYLARAGSARGRISSSRDSGGKSPAAGPKPLKGRFDAVLITPGRLGLPKITHIPDAWR